ncbi:MAG: proliferating cell nuclear antigen (pcna) [Candidatus Caldarchaeum sp.]
MNVDVRFSNGGVFANVIRAVSLLVDEASFVFDVEGLRLSAMDPYHAALLSLALPADRFEHYNIDEGRTVTLNIRDLMKILKRGGETQLDMSFDAEKNKLHLMFQEKGRSKSFSLQTYETHHEPASISRVSFSAEAVIDVETFKQVVEDGFLVGDVLRIKASDDELVFDAGSPAENTYSMRVRKDGAALRLLECSEPTTACYSLTYLEKIVDGCRPLTDTVSLAFASDKPMKITALDGVLTYYLAPRLDTF